MTLVDITKDSEKDGNVYIAINEAAPLLYDPADAVSIFELA